MDNIEGERESNNLTITLHFAEILLNLAIKLPQKSPTLSRISFD